MKSVVRTVAALLLTSALFGGAHAGEPPRASLRYALAGHHATRGAFTGTLEAELQGGHARIVQTMVFAAGEQTVTVEGALRDGRVRGVVEPPRAGAVHALPGSAWTKASPRWALEVDFSGDAVRTRLVRAEQELATASGALRPEPLDQGLSPEQAEVWHTRGHGLKLLAADWFLSLEQPQGEARFAAPEWLAQFGFLPGGAEGLPVGFAVQSGAVGLSCAACHTAELTVGDASVRIEGGRANIDLDAFRGSLAQALAATAQNPDKLGRFAQRVLTRRAQPVTPEALRAVGGALGDFLRAAQARAQQVAALGLTGTANGPGRVDAYGNGANAIAGPLNPANLAPPQAPVRLPYLWGAQRFAWVQYNGGIRLPLARNLIASIAAGAELRLLDANGALLPPEQRFESSSRVEDLTALEGAMRTIQPPRWPGYVDLAAARRGEVLYRRLCADCHEPDAWAEGADGARYLELPMFDLDAIGTDPGEALAFRRTVDATRVGLGAATPLPELLAWVSDGVLAKQGHTPARPNGFRAPAAYRARPLEGIWAGAPYLHNGSVLTMDELLGPPSERRAQFRLSTRPRLDTERLGLLEPTAGFLYDTRQPGNSNAGHAFRDAPPNTPGVVGPALDAEQRRALIAFLKTR